LQDERAWFITTSRNMAVNKVLGVSQTQLAPLLVGLLVGPTGAGTYDALSRLPRAIKSVLGLLSSTVLPVAARLETSADARGMQRLGQGGILIVGIFALPPVAASMVFSKPLLDLWVGNTLSSFWGWQALMLLIPALTALLSFGGTALLVRPQVTSTMNRLIAMQVALQFLLAGLAVAWLQERAFILGQVLAVVITFGLQLRLVCSELSVGWPVLQRLLKVATALVALSGLAWSTVSFIESWATLGLAMSSLTAVGWAIGLQLGLIPAERNRLRAEICRRFVSK
jgi:O-antigen/teichoic acid export membrane protein